MCTLHTMYITGDKKNLIIDITRFAVVLIFFFSMYRCQSQQEISAESNAQFQKNTKIMSLT